MERDELHEQVMLLKDDIKEGRVRVREGLTAADSLQKVRLAPDGKVDPSTVDSSVRAMAMAAAYARFRREVKKVPLRESQEQYFQILEQFFGNAFAEMKKHKLTPPDLAKDMASRPKIVEAFAAEAKEFAAGIKEFWEFYGPVVEAHLQDMRSLKSVFGGDIFPSYTENIASSVGLYVDTLVLPDPLLRTTNFSGYLKPKQVLAFTVKHALNALQYKELALADVDPPIVVIAPDPLYVENSYGPVLQLAGEADLLAHSSRLFGHDFANFQELTDFLEKFPDPGALIASLSDASRLLFDVDWSGPDDQIRRYTSEINARLTGGASQQSVGKAVQFGLLGRMMQANDVLFKASRVQGNPLVDAPTSWQYLL